MQSELKTCPFCGGVPHLMHCGAGTYMVQCLQCKATTDDGGVERISGNWNRRTALSDEERAVEVKALEWECGRSDWPKLAVSVVGIYEIWANFDLVTPAPTRCIRCRSIEHAVETAQADYEQRIRSALVDVPVEPVAWWYEDSTGCQHMSTDMELGARHARETGHALNYLYPSPSLPHRGEDSAEVIEEGAKILAKWIGYAWDGLGERDISADYRDWAYNGIGALGMQGGKPALRKVASSILALTATRSASATSPSGDQT